MGCHTLLQGIFSTQGVEPTSFVPPTLASPIAQLVKNLPARQKTPVRFLVGKIRWRRDRLPTPVLFCFPCGSAGKESACNAGDLGSMPGLGRYPGKGNSYPLQYSGLENSTDHVVHGITESDTTKQLSLSTFFSTFVSPALAGRFFII